jgi:hypothetical protein
MRNRTLILLFLGALAVLVIAGCAPKPDLEAVKLLDLETDPVAYCNLDADGSLLVTVTNQGAAIAPESTTRVTFTTSTGDVVTEMRTPRMDIGDSEQLDMGAVPANCYQADCFFTITVDAANEIDELDEENNSARGYCLG